jgi:outer membrane immunogenic protein
MNRWLLTCVLLCGFVGSAAAADMAVPGLYRAPLVAPLYSWTACYIGVNIGGGAAPMNRIDTIGTFGPGGPTGTVGTFNPAFAAAAAAGSSLGGMTARGVAGGGQLGCDYQAGAFVFGLQGLVDLSGMKGSNILPDDILFNNSYVQTVATVTGRLGYTVLPTLLLYGKAGGAFAHDIHAFATSPGSNTPFFPGTLLVGPATGGATTLVPPGTIIALGPRSTTGWTAGIGAEWAFAHAPVSLSLEYDYLGFRNQQVPFLATIVQNLVFPIEVSQRIHMVLFGINLRFGSGNDF